MKISKKLLISNVLISLISMVLLSFILTSLITDHYESLHKRSLEKMHNSAKSWLSYSHFFTFNETELILNEELIDKISNRTTSSEMAVKLTSVDSTQVMSPNAVASELFDMGFEPSENIIRTHINKTDFLVLLTEKTTIYNDKIYTIQVMTYVNNFEANKTNNQIIMLIVVTIIIIGVMSFIFTHLHEKQLTKPIKELVAATKRIGEKNYDKMIPNHNIDEYTLLYEAINDMTDQLKQMDENQRQFYENISHEFKTPLAVVSGYAQGIQNDILASNDEGIETIIEEANQLKDLIEDSIFLSKLDAPNEYYQIEQGNIVTCIGDALDEFEVLLLEKEIDIYFEPDKDIIVEFDYIKMKRIFKNILLNCLRFAQSTIMVSVTQNEHVEIIFKDDGKGFSNEILREPFSRNRFNSSEGNGIGMSIIKKVIDGHHASISIYNDDGAVYKITMNTQS